MPRTSIRLSGRKRSSLPMCSTSHSAEPALSTSPLIFPPTQNPALPRTRRRVSPSRRVSDGHIPRPMNAFMLFRQNFVRQRRVPVTIDPNANKLSKIAGLCWRALPLKEKKIWQDKAKQVKEEHKLENPNYQFRPVRHKNKEKKKPNHVKTLEDKRICEEVAQLRKTEADVAAAICESDLMRTKTQPASPLFHHYRSSSVPLPNPNNQYYTYNPCIAIHNAPVMPGSRPPSPVNSIACQQQRMMLGTRRAVSALAVPVHQPWTFPVESMTDLSRANLPLSDEVDTTHLNPNLNFNSFPTFNNHQQFIPSHSYHDQSAFRSLDSISRHSNPIQEQQYMNTNNSTSSSLPDPDLLSWLDPHIFPHSYPSTAYSGSPPLSDVSLPVLNAVPVVHAPQPKSAAPTAMAFEDLDKFWKECESGLFTSDPTLYEHLSLDDAGLGMNFDPRHTQEDELSSTKTL